MVLIWWGVLSYLGGWQVGGPSGAVSVDRYYFSEGGGRAVSDLPAGAEEVLAELVAEPFQRPVGWIAALAV